MLRVVKVRLYPNKEQIQKISQHLGSCRYVYNLPLDAKIKAYELKKRLVPMKKVVGGEFLKEVDSTALQNSVLKIDVAYKNFFRRVKQAGAVGFPRFKSKHNSYQSYQSSTANVKDGKLYLPKIGQIKTKFHRGAIIGKIKTVTVSREANQYFFLHKISNQLSENQTVKVEDLKIKNMSKQAKGSIENPNMRASAKSGLNRSILQQSWGKFFELLEYKLHRNGGVLVKVDPKFTSQKCSECGHTAKENRLKQELFVCVKCSFTANADYIPFIFKKMDNLQSPYLLAS